MTLQFILNYAAQGQLSTKNVLLLDFDTGV